MPNVSLSEFYADKKALVTGGFGFVGSHLARTLAGFHADVTVYDVDTSADRRSLLNDANLRLRDRLTICKGDVTDRDATAKLMRQGRFDYVFHLAAGSTAIEQAMESPLSTVQSNTLGTVILLEAVRVMPRSERPKVVLLTSTDKVYGEMDGTAYEEERTPLRGIGVYDSAKLAADVFTRAYHEAFGLPTIVLRMCNVFGSDDHSEHRLLPRAMRSIFGTDSPEPPELYFGAIDHWRDYIFVEDAVRAMLLLACEPKCRGDVFNLPGAAFISTPEMFKKVVEISASVEEHYSRDRARKIRDNGIRVNGLHPNPNADKLVVIKKQHLNGDKIQKAVGFEPGMSLDEALLETVKAYRHSYR